MSYFRLTELAPTNMKQFKTLVSCKGVVSIKFDVHALAPSQGCCWYYPVPNYK